MLTANQASQRARWAVIWVYSNNGRRKLARKNFGDDYASAEELYLKARDAGKQAVTLACVNMGFPPPTNLRPYTVLKKGRDRRTHKIRVVRVSIQPLRDLNHQGKLWCPYCRKLRPFVLKKSFVLDGIRVSDPKYVCPICGVSHRDHNVRVWNPTAVIHMESAVASRRMRKTTTKRRRRTRR